MANREQIIQEYGKYFPGRKVSDQDIQNAMDKGIDVIKGSYNQITGQQNTNTDTATAGGQGQDASNDPLANTLDGQIKDVRSRRTQLMDTKNDFLSLTQDMLTKTQQVVAPFNEQQKMISNKITNLPAKEAYKGLAPDAILRKSANNISYWQNELNYSQQQEADALQKIQDEKSFLLQGFEDQVAAYGMTLDDLLGERNYQLQLAQLARSGGGGGGSGGSSNDAMAWVQAIAEGRATLTQVPSSARESVVALMNQYGVNAPQEIGAYPTYDQWFQQNYGNMSVPDPYAPDLQKEYQLGYQQYNATRNNPFMSLINGFGGQGAGAGTGTETGNPLDISSIDDKF